MIPPKEILYHNSAAEASFLGYAHSQLATLRDSMAFQGLNEGYRKISPYTGVVVEAWKSFSLEGVTVSVDEEVYGKTPYERKLREEKTVLDNRFFVRIGEPSDIETDILGHVIRDDTRYYWIDFFAVTDNNISFYEPGEKYNEYEIDDTIYFEEARFVTDETFLQVVNFPDYMFHNYVRSFDLENTVGEEVVLARFVAGYHFLAVNDGIIFTPTIPTVAGGDVDLATGTSKNPPNRFFVDLESRTMCWYHVLQKWKVETPPGRNETTGSMSGTVKGIDMADGEWSITACGDYSFSGDIADGVVENIGSDSFLGPIGIASDIESLDRTTLKINLSYKCSPFRLTCSMASEVVSVESCASINDIYTVLVAADGYDWHQSATFTLESGAAATDGDGDTTSYSVNECVSGGACPEEIQLMEDSWSWGETSSAWSEAIMQTTFYGVSPCGFSQIVEGKNNGTYSENLEAYLHYCYPVLGGYCNDGTYHTAYGRSMQGSTNGSFGTLYDITSPCQNVMLHVSTSEKVIGVQINRHVYGNDDGYPDIDTSLNVALAHWNTSNPLYQPSPSPFSICNQVYPKGYNLVDPAEFLSLENFPIPLNPLSFFSAGGSGQWYNDAAYSHDQTTDVDVCVIKDCPDTFTASELFSAVILDDRWSEGSQGIVIAVKSNATGETAIYHNGTNKLSDIMYALSRDGLLKTGEALFDIGLI